MATTGPAEGPTSGKVNNCDNSSNSGSKLVNGCADPDFNSPENNNAMKEGGYRYNHHTPNYDHHRINQNSHHPPPPQDPSKGGMDAPPDYSQQQQQQQQPYHYPPYNRGQGYDQQQQQPPPPPMNNGPDSYQQHQQHPGYPPPMRYPGKPMPGPGGPSGNPPQPHGYSQGPPNMRPNYPGGMGNSGQSISQPSGQTPTLNQLLQSPGGANSGASTAGGAGHRYPPPPPAGYEHPYPPPNPNNPPAPPTHGKADYSQGPTGWPVPNRPPPNSYAHPPPFQQQPQQPMYRQNAPGGGKGPQPPSSGQPQPPPPQHQPYYQHHHGGYPPPPPQSPHYPPPPHQQHQQQRYPSPGPGMRPPDNQPPYHYPQHPPGMQPPDMGSSGSEPPKSTPPPPPSPSHMNHGQPPSPQQSPRSTPHPPPTSSSNSLPPPSSPSQHRPQGSSPSSNYPPPDIGEVTGCNSNDGVGGGASQNQPGGPRPSPSPTGSAGSRSMSPAVGNQNIPMPPRPPSSQSDGSNAPRMSQSPMSGHGGGSYPGQPMAPPSHHMYQPGGKMPHQGGVVPPSQSPGGGHPPPSQPHYPHQQPPPPPQSQQHWSQQHQQQGGYGARPPGPPGHGNMMSPYPPPSTQQPIQPNNYGSPRHPMPNHVGGPPPPPASAPGGNQYNPYPPHYPPPSQAPNWPNATGAPSPRSQMHLKQQQQHKGGYTGYGTPPPHHPHQPGGPSEPPDMNSIPPSLVSVGPDGANVDELSQQSTLSNTSGASGDDGPPMPKLRPEGGRPHPGYPPQGNAASSPGAASMNSAHDEYADSPSWPRTPASPGLNSHPPPSGEHFKGKNKKADSLNKLYDMDDNPERRMFLDKLIHYMEDNSTPIASCPTISKNPLDLFKLYLLVKERGGFLEVSKSKTWKDIAGSLGIGASSSAAYTLRKHYTKHLFAFECKFDRGGIDPLPLINQVETTTKKKGGKTAAPVPSPGSSNSQDSLTGPNNTSSSSMDGFNSTASSNYPTYGQSQGGEYGTPAPTTPSPRPQSQNSQPPQHTGEKSQINLSNPFDDQQHPHHFQQQQSRPNHYPPYTTSQPYSGYQGGYPPYPPQGEQQYPGRPPMGPQEPYPGQGYGRPMYPPYSEGGPPPSGAPYPPQPSAPNQPPAAPPSSTPHDERYNVGPATSTAPNGPPQPPGGYPNRSHFPPPSSNQTQPSSTPSSQTGPHPPPNGYPNQDYYNSQPQTEQGYQPGGKHMPPPHASQGMRYPSKEGGPSQYPNYPSQAPGAPSQPRGPSYDGQPGSRVNFAQPRSSPSPSPVVPAQPPLPPPQKPYNTSEGWPNSGGYPPQRAYPSPQAPPTPSHPTQQVASPISSQSPGAPGPTPPQQAISPSPQPWGPSPSAPTRGPPTSSSAQGPPPPPPGATWPDSRYSSNPPQSIMPPSPATGPTTHSQPPWTPPSGQSRLPGTSPRSPYPPGGKPVGPPSEMFRSYGPSPSSLQKGPLGAPGVQSQGPSFPPVGAAASIPKKEIVFPTDSIEAITPVLSRRRKLHKSDVSPVEAWRIMMSLKSGLLAEVTWALDVLNILLYDDQSISYFSLTYLPGLLDILLEHLRRALIILFGQSVGIDFNSDKMDDSEKPMKPLEWYESIEQSEEEVPDLGTPRRKFPRDAHRTLLLQGSTNYTMVSRVRGRKVRIVQKDDEPFIVSGTRDWDMDEKSRNEPELDQPAGAMDSTKHIITYFTTTLPSPLPIVRCLKSKTSGCDSNKICESTDENFDYHCETKVPTFVAEPSPSTTTSTPTSTSNSDATPILSSALNSTTPSPKKPTPENGPIASEKLLDKLTESKLLQIAAHLTTSSFNSSKVNSVIQKKVRRLDDVLGRIRKDQVEDENALSEAPISNDVETSLESESNAIAANLTLTTSVPQPTPVLENGLSDTEDSEDSNMSAANSENTCDSSKHFKNVEMRIGDLIVRDPGATLKRKQMDEYEDECYTRDEGSLSLILESQDSLARRCLSICNIIRNLTFVPSNEMEFGKCIPFLSLVGKLILLHHDHPLKKKAKSRPESSSDQGGSASSEVIKPNENEGEVTKPNEPDSAVNNGEAEVEESLFAEEPASDFASASVEIEADSCTSLTNDEEWWWDYVHHIREHVLVMIANISGQMDLSQFSEEISRPILDGLLHWAVCPAAYGQDPFPTLSPITSLSPQRLAIEALVKLSVIQGNVDLLLATPPFSRIERLCQLLCRSLCRTEEQVMREFALNLLYYLSAADTGVARTIALQNPCISLLISFIEQAEQNALNIANNHGFSVLRENPEAMGTSLDMLRRAAMTLLNLARHPDNRALFVQHEPRLLQLVMSQILEQKVAAMVAQVLYQCSTPDAITSQKYLYASNMDTFYAPLFSRNRIPPQAHAS